jgi:hypothetical protein
MPTHPVVDLRATNTPRSSRRIAVALLGGGLTVLLAACGGAKADSDAAGPAESSTTTAPSTTTTTAPRKPCTPANLQAAVSPEYANPTVLDVTCSTAFAVATLSSSRGTHLVYFGSQPDGSWAMLKVSQLEADPVGEAPAGLPQSLAAGWKANYAGRIEREKNPTSGGVQGGEDFPTTTEPPHQPISRPPERDPQRRWLRSVRQNVDELAAPPLAELHLAGGGREQGVVATATDVVARMDPRAALAHDDRACGDGLAVEPLDPEALALRVAAVPCRTAAFGLRHAQAFLIFVISIVS